MKVEYTYMFDLPRDLVWKYIQDEQVLRNALPGCKTFREKEDGVYHAEMGLAVGPVKGLFVSEVQQVNQQPPSSYRLLIKSKGTPGEIDAVADMVIEEVETASKLTCIAEVHGTGVIASIGQRVMGGVAKVILGQFFKAAEKEMKKLVTPFS
jgi:carbon monoxide dehydrogenase subunit G